VTSVTTYGSKFTGTPRTIVNEWGNITIMGRALISSSHKNDGSTVQSYDETEDLVANPVNNTLNPTGSNKANMEGLVGIATGDAKVIYGGNDDNDDSGSLAYVSLRYGGKVVGLTNELNGLSLGGIGRNTDIHHIDIFGNVDDGIEIWGGTVNLKYVNIWNIGDDSFDVDQGWRGKAQFGLIVQGYGTQAAQGSGAGDNIFEIDGAERSDAQPVTTAAIYNFTAIGQPGSTGGDHGTAWRDEARVQYRNCIFMDLGEQLVREEASETGTGSWRYSIAGTPTFAQVWTTAYTDSHVLAAAAAFNRNPGDSVGDLQNRYQGQSAGNANGLDGDPGAGSTTVTGQGFLAEITDSVFYNNLFASAYSNTDGADAQGVTISGGSNFAKANIVAGSSPITTLTRETPAAFNSLVMANVATLDPRAANDAVTSVGTAPLDGFYTPAKWRGAFSSTVNWAKGWTAADAYGKFVGPANPTDPTATMFLAASTSFSTVNGTTYVIESSTDGANWKPLTTVTGDGTVKKFADFDNNPLAASTVYRVYVLQ